MTKITKFIYKKIQFIKSKAILFNEFLTETRLSDYEVWKSSDKNLAQHFSEKILNLVVINLLAGFFLNLAFRYIFKQSLTAGTVIGYTTFHWLLFKVLSYYNGVKK